MINIRAGKSITLTTAMAGVFIGTEISVPGAVQQEQVLMLKVSDARPLARAVQELERRHGWLVTYEDPPYFDTGDLVDVTRVVRKNFDPRDPRILVPRGGTLELSYSVPLAGTDPTQVLENLLREYRNTGASGVFRLTRTGSLLHVVPTECRNAMGELQNCVSFLDTKISLPDEERNALQMLEAVTGAVAATAHHKIGLGTVPINLLIHTRVRQGAQNESARAILIRTLAATSRKLSWSLLCDPGGSDVGCALNVHFVDDGSGGK